jgi:hypothetical protein
MTATHMKRNNHKRKALKAALSGRLTPDEAIAQLSEAGEQGIIEAWLHWDDGRVQNMETGEIITEEEYEARPAKHKLIAGTPELGVYITQ